MLQKKKKKKKRGKRVEVMEQDKGKERRIENFCYKCNVGWGLARDMMKHNRWLHDELKIEYGYCGMRFESQDQCDKHKALKHR